MDRAFGVTANYVYRLQEVEQNHEAYAREFKVIASPTMARLADRAHAARAKYRSP